MIGFRMTLCCIQECPLCGGNLGLDEHSPNCLIGQRDSLAKRADYDSGICPCCRSGTIAVNTDDLFECRECHTLLTTADSLVGGDNLLKYVSLPSSSDLVPMKVLSNKKGAGIFKYDAEIAKLNKEIKKATKRE